MEALTVLIWMFNVSFVAALIFGTLFLLRWKYQRDVAPSKKYPQGRMLGEFWDESGPRPRELVEILTNGMEIKVPSGHKAPRYFFSKGAMGTAKYPVNPLLPIRFIQVDVPIASWYRDCPEAIPSSLSSYLEEASEASPDSIVLPRERGRNWRIAWLRPHSLMTAEMHDLVRDTDSLAAGQAINEEMSKTQEELAKALSHKLDRRYVYILLMLSAVGALGAAVFAYKAFEAARLIS